MALHFQFNPARKVGGSRPALVLTVSLRGEASPYLRSWIFIPLPDLGLRNLVMDLGLLSRSPCIGLVLGFIGSPSAKATLFPRSCCFAKLKGLVSNEEESYAFAQHLVTGRCGRDSAVRGAQLGSIYCADDSTTGFRNRGGAARSSYAWSYGLAHPFVPRLCNLSTSISPP